MDPRERGFVTFACIICQFVVCQFVQDVIWLNIILRVYIFYRNENEFTLFESIQKLQIAHQINIDRKYDVPLEKFDKNQK